MTLRGTPTTIAAGAIAPPPATDNGPLTNQRLGIFGGSFDPVHHGHLALARACRDQAGLDEVWFVPAAVQPHKPHGPVASDADRLAMLRLAVGDQLGLIVSDLEIARGGVSYTVDTLRALHSERPGAALYLLMGADTLADLPNWREPDAIRALAHLLVVHRPGEPRPEGERLTVVEMALLDLSSSEVRRRVAAGESFEGMTPPPVAAYIAERKLYRE